jgi:hypothetical protein
MLSFHVRCLSGLFLLVATAQSGRCAQPLPEGAVARLGLPSKMMVVTVAFSPHGRTLVSAHKDHSLRIWDVPARKLVQTIRSPEKTITAIFFGPDGKSVLTADEDSTVIWDIASGRKERAFRVPGQRLLHVAYSAEGQPLAWTEDNKHVIRQWDVTTGKEQRQFRGHCARILSVDFWPAGNVLASTSKDAVRLWDCAGGKELHQLKRQSEPFPGREARNDSYRLLKFAPNGWMVYAKGEEGDSYCIWETTTGKAVLSYDRFQGPHAGKEKALTPTAFAGPLVFTPDSKVLLWAEGGDPLARSISFHQVATFGSAGQAFGQTSAEISCLAFSRNGQNLASGCLDGTIYLWASNTAFWNQDREPWTISQKETEELWKNLGSDDGKKVYRALWRFALSESQGVDFLQKKLRPVRSVAVERIRRLIDDLDVDALAVRENALMELEEIGAAAEEELRRTSQGKPSAEVRQKVEMLLAGLNRPRFRRALQVLEQINSRSARDVIKELASGTAGAWPTQKARAALQRLARQPEAAPVASKTKRVEIKVEIPPLRSSSWSVCRRRRAHSEVSIHLAIHCRRGPSHASAPCGYGIGTRSMSLPLHPTARR